jgi:putative transposase
VIDSQSVKTTESGGPRGFDAGKRVKGRKHHAMDDTDERALVLQVYPASVQDRDGAVPLLQASLGSFTFVEHVFADTAYVAERVAHATSIVVEIVRKLPDQFGFAVFPRRWVVERFLAWINRNRRLAKDLEATVASATAFLYAASACLSEGSRVRHELRVKLNRAATAEPLTSGDGWVQTFGEHQRRGTNEPRDFSCGATAALETMSAFFFCQCFDS